MTDPPTDDRDAEERELLTVEQVAQLRRVTPAAVRAQLRAGTLAGEQVLQGQRTVWRIPASAVRRDRPGTGRPAVGRNPGEAPAGPPAGNRPAAPVTPSEPEPAPSEPGQEPAAPVTGEPGPRAPDPLQPARLAALEAEVRRLRRQLAHLADAHHRLLDALTADGDDDPLR
ncbi:hypothetical protein ACI79D_02410 [Geodermatophilus sp. SYSU D00708]